MGQPGYPPGYPDASDRSQPARHDAGGVQGRWLIEPVASPDDSRWQDRPIWRRVVVTAGSAAFARLAAEAWALPRVPPQIGNESDASRAGFLDEKLYRVTALRGDSGEATSHRADRNRVIDAELLRAAPDIIEI